MIVDLRATIWNSFGAAIFVLSATGGCSGSHTSPDLEGEWTLVSIARDGGSESPVPEGITLDISGADASGFSGCNTYGFSFELPTDSDFRITSGIATTKKACSDDIMSFESVFLSSLASSLEIKSDGEGVMLVGGEAVLSFTRSDSATD